MNRYVVTGALLFVSVCALWLNFRLHTWISADPNLEPSEVDRARTSLTDPMADHDKDGLANWEEDLYGTSKLHADSDGDGIADGVELIQGYDPTGRLEHTQPGQQIEVIQEPLETYAFTQTADPPSLKEIAQRLVYTDQSNVVSEHERTDTPIPLTPQQVQAKRTLNRIGVVMANSIVSSQQDIQTLNALTQGVTNNTYALEKIIQALEPTAEAYQLVLEGLRDQEIAAMVERLQEIARGSIDSAKTIVALYRKDVATSSPALIDGWRAYGDLQTQWVTVIVDLHHLLKARGISFNPSEPGHTFMFAM